MFYFTVRLARPGLRMEQRAGTGKFGGAFLSPDSPLLYRLKLLSSNLWRYRG
jgi:hypothetical protein